MTAIIRTLYTTNEVAVSIVEEVIKEHASKILEQLGMTEDNDGILDRITASAFIPTKETAWNGVFRSQTITRGFFASGGQRYKEGSGSIEINAICAMYFFNKKDKSFHVPIVRLPFFRSLYRRGITFVLAHELRHYWQAYTGECYKHDHAMGMNLMPYQWRWEEKDANEFAREYVESLSRR